MRLLADIGGTNTRCVLADEDGFRGAVMTLRNDDHADLGSALETFIGASAELGPVHAGALAVAAPVQGDEVSLTNRGWSFSVRALRARLGLERMEVINDFTAVALSLPELAASELVKIGGGTPVANAALAVVGPGTGLGVSGLIPREGGWAAIAGEGGHVTLPAFDELEARVIARQRARKGHVSAEHFLSGPGLVTLYAALAAEFGETASGKSPDTVSRLAAEGDALAGRTLEMFFAMLGTVAADLALILGARGGVYLGGGILPKLGKALAASPFRLRFEDKGRYSDYLRHIPTYLITAEHPGLIGLKTLLDCEPAA